MQNIVDDNNHSIGSKSIVRRESLNGWRNADIKIVALTREELVIAHKFR